MKHKVLTTMTAALAVVAMSVPAAALEAVTETGVPEGFTEDQWLAAQAEVQFLEPENNNHVIQLTAEGLVPQGIYTIWAVETGLFGMRAHPGGGLPANTFVADRDGEATRVITVEADNPYDRMVIAYHADHRTHGETPGEMGEVTFQHFAGAWPQPE